jgi:hypothetical protein
MKYYIIFSNEKLKIKGLSGNNNFKLNASNLKIELY